MKLNEFIDSSRKEPKYNFYVVNNCANLLDLFERINNILNDIEVAGYELIGISYHPETNNYIYHAQLLNTV